MNYLILNYKTYEESTGGNAERLTEVVSQVQQMYRNVQIIVCPQATDLYRLKQRFPEQILWAQHADPLYPGKNTGWITPSAAVAAGASGVLINHSEHDLIDEMIAHSLEAARAEHLETCLLLPDPGSLDEIAKAHADAIPESRFSPPAFAAYEPPELVGGDYSVMDHPESHSKAKAALGAFMRYQSIPIVGAGVKDASDIRQAIEMGYRGVILASGFVKSDNPQKFLEQLLSAYPH
jgi:triosephosphate isomerase